MIDFVGKKILHYKIVEKLGEGGMGVVYLAEDIKLKRQVAIKFLPHHITKNSDEGKRFEIEAQAAAALNHPNIATIHNIEEADDELFIVMEYVKGKNLKDHIGLKPIAVKEAIDIATQIARGLEEAHNKGIVHRDIKSANIMINEKGGVKIMDFGLAKVGAGVQLTKEQSTLGTAAYMSPEQAGGDEVDQRADMWSLGVVFYEMLTGRLPFKGDYEQAVIYSILNEDPDYSQAPDTLHPVLKKLLARNPEERYADLSQFLTDLNQVKFMKTEKPENERFSQSNKRVSKLLIISCILIVLAGIIYFGIPVFEQIPDNTDTSKRIAVLPFKNLNGNASQEYFSDGMTETIISDLANIGNLTVISRTSVMSYKNSGKNTREIGQELNVTHILEGSVLTFENKVRIFAQLIDANTDAHLWAQTYDRELNDLFSIQSDVANMIAKIMEVALNKDAQARIDQRPTTNLDAYRLYLQGQYYINLAGSADIDSAITLLNQAISMDPNFALAYAVLATTYILNNVDQIPRPEWEEKAYISFQQALSLDPDLAEAYVARGMWYWTPGNNFQHESAIKDFKKAIELKPGLSSAYEMLSKVQRHVGLLEKALITGQKALELEPTSMWARLFLGQVYFFQGNYPEALNMFKSMSEKFIPFYRLTFTSQTLLHLNRTDEAVAMLKQGLAEYPEESLLNSSYAIILASLGQKDQAVERMKLAIEHESALMHIHHLYHNLAGASALLGRQKEAVEWLIKASDDGLTCYPLFDQDPNLRSLKGNPEFEKFMAELRTKWEYYKTL